MTAPTLEQVLHDAQQLPFEDQRALLTLLTPLKGLEQLAAEQGIRPFNVEAARKQAAGIWPEEESIDDFIAWLRGERKERAAESEID